MANTGNLHADLIDSLLENNDEKAIAALQQMQSILAKTITKVSELDDPEVRCNVAIVLDQRFRVYEADKREGAAKGKTPLMVAVAKGKTQLVTMILGCIKQQAQAENPQNSPAAFQNALNLRDTQNHPALTLAVRSKNPQLVKAIVDPESFLNKGANDEKASNHVAVNTTTAIPQDILKQAAIEAFTEPTILNCLLPYLDENSKTDLAFEAAKTKNFVAYDALLYVGFEALRMTNKETVGHHLAAAGNVKSLHSTIREVRRNARVDAPSNPDYFVTLWFKTKDEQGFTILGHAVKNGQRKFAKILIRDYYTADRDEINFLVKVATHNHDFEMILILAQGGSIPDCDWATVLKDTTEDQCLDLLQRATQKESDETKTSQTSSHTLSFVKPGPFFDYLQQRGFNKLFDFLMPSLRSEQTGHAVHALVRKGDLTQLDILLKNHPFAVEYYDTGDRHTSGRQPLFYTAGAHNGPAIARRLIAAKADTNAQSTVKVSIGWQVITPVSVAIEKMDAPVIQVLLDAGASPTHPIGQCWLLEILAEQISEKTLEPQAQAQFNACVQALIPHTDFTVQGLANSIAKKILTNGRNFSSFVLQILQAAGSRISESAFQEILVTCMTKDANLDPLDPADPLVVYVVNSIEDQAFLAKVGGHYGNKGLLKLLTPRLAKLKQDGPLHMKLSAEFLERVKHRTTANETKITTANKAKTKNPGQDEQKSTSSQLSRLSSPSECAVNEFYSPAFTTIFILARIKLPIDATNAMAEASDIVDGLTQMKVADLAKWEPATLAGILRWVMRVDLQKNTHPELTLHLWQHLANIPALDSLFVATNDQEKSIAYELVRVKHNPTGAKALISAFATLAPQSFLASANLVDTDAVDDKFLNKSEIANLHAEIRNLVVNMKQATLLDLLFGGEIVRRTNAQYIAVSANKRAHQEACWDESLSMVFTYQDNLLAVIKALIKDSQTPPYLSQFLLPQIRETAQLSAATQKTSTTEHKADAKAENTWRTPATTQVNNFAKQLFQLKVVLQTRPERYSELTEALARCKALEAPTEISVSQAVRQLTRTATLPSAPSSATVLSATGNPDLPRQTH